jgi:hypothetical protein
MDLAERAAALRPTHDENLTTLAFVAFETSNEDAAEAALVDLLRRIPQIAASQEWADSFPAGNELRQLMIAADQSWETLDVDDGRFALPQVWLNAVIGEHEETLAGRYPGWANVGYLAATDALLRCEIEKAEDAILRSPPSVPTDAELTATIMVANVIGRPDAVEDAVALANLRRVPVGRLAVSPSVSVSSFWDPGEDRRLYKRAPVAPVDLSLALPTEESGLRAWLLDPRAAARVGAPGSGLVNCASAR